MSARDFAWQFAPTEHVRLRLNQLQGQLEPHFLFNTLNTISALVRSGDRGRALSALMQVSSMVRHTLRVRTASWISVQDELGFIREYLELQRLRFGDRIQLDWSLAGAPWDLYACAPLLLQPLVENAFHHCVELSPKLEHIQIELRADAGTLELVVANRIPPAPVSAPRGVRHGLGLAATRERLALLYGDAASLTAGAQGQRFVAVLKFPLRDLHEQMVCVDR